MHWDPSPTSYNSEKGRAMAEDPWSLLIGLMCSYFIAQLEVKMTHPPRSLQIDVDNILRDIYQYLE